ECQSVGIRDLIRIRHARVRARAHDNRSPAAHARKSEISVAAYRAYRALGSSRRGKAGQVDSWDLSSGLGRTRAIIEDAHSHATEKRRRRSKRSGLFSTQRSRERATGSGERKRKSGKRKERKSE
ncbi:hypothetical protein ALC60_02156, partial [Trachymyrmex zeteki]